MEEIGQVIGPTAFLLCILDVVEALVPQRQLFFYLLILDLRCQTSLSEGKPLAPTLCVGAYIGTLCVAPARFNVSRIRDAERPGWVPTQSVGTRRTGRKRIHFSPCNAPSERPRALF
jgi:hypothetical protein